MTQMGAAAGLATREGRAQALDQMMRGRAFDQAMCRHNPHWHEARGEEAVYVGAFRGLRHDDVVAPHFRGACGVSLLRGADPFVLAASVFGKEAGASRGAWRGDICPTPSATFLGMFSGALGGSVAYATGAGLRLHLAGTDAVAVCAFGDGTANSGIVHESMNLASVLRLPVVYVCQDNQYATSLPSAVAVAGGSVPARAEALGIPAGDVDGNDIYAVSAAVAAAVVRARSGHGPSLVHARTYRLGGHFMNDPEVYRSPEEVAREALRDPLPLMIADLVDRGEIDADAAGRRLEAVDAEMERIVLEAKGAPETPGEGLARRAYAEDREGAQAR